MPTAKVNVGWRVTLPRQVREVLRLRAGDRVDFVLSEAGDVVLRAATVDVRTLKGLLKRPGRRPVSLRSMEAAIRRR